MIFFLVKYCMSGWWMDIPRRSFWNDCFFFRTKDGWSWPGATFWFDGSFLLPMTAFPVSSSLVLSFRRVLFVVHSWLFTDSTLDLGPYINETVAFLFIVFPSHARDLCAKSNFNLFSPPLVLVLCRHTSLFRRVSKLTIIYVSRSTEVNLNRTIFSTGYRTIPWCCHPQPRPCRPLTQARRSN